MARKKKKNKAAAAEAPADVPAALSAEEFTASVRELKASDISGGEKPKPKKLSPLENIIQLILIVVCAAVFITSAVLLVKNLWGKYKGSSLYDNVASDFNIISGDKNAAKMYASLNIGLSDSPMQMLYERLNSGKTDAQQGESGSKLDNVRASLSSLKSINPDVYGWIYVENSSINYPIMRGINNSYYLDHAYTHEYLPIGSISADFSTRDVITDNYNTVLHGHNVITSLSSSSMFHDITKFLQKDFFDSALIQIYTMDGAYTYKPVAIYQARFDYIFTRTEFISDASFAEFANEVVANSMFDAGMIIEPTDKLLTMATCTNGARDDRYVLHAKLIEEIH